MKNIFIYSYIEDESRKYALALKEKLSANGFNVLEKFSKDADMTIVVGGDGCFLHAVRATGFSSVPLMGINTGHLGFFAEFSSDEIDKAVELCKSGKFTVQKHKAIHTIVEKDGMKEDLGPALNDVLVRSRNDKLIHLNLSIGDTFIEAFSGDGLLISSSAGSTAYNYNLGGSIVDPALDLLQITPRAPINNTAYRSFTSSLLLPSKEEVIISPLDNKGANIVLDGEEYIRESFDKIYISLSKEEIQIVRLPDYSFWNKVKSKFL